MKPDDRDGRTFEQKIVEAAKLAGFELTTDEQAGLKQRISFVLMGSNASDLTVRQLSDWVKRCIPPMRLTASTIDAHVALAGNEAPSAVHAGLFPESLLRRFAEGGDPYQMSSNAQEVVCSLVGDRRARVDPSNLVVTPLRAVPADVKD